MSVCKVKPEGCPSYFAKLPVCELPNRRTGAMYTAFYVNKDAQPFRSAIQTLVWSYPYTSLQAVTSLPRFRNLTISRLAVRRLHATACHDSRSTVLKLAVLRIQACYMPRGGTFRAEGEDTYSSEGSLTLACCRRADGHCTQDGKRRNAATR